jgi:hypothetical protein
MVRELRIRSSYGKHRIQMIVPDAVGTRRVVKENILVMLDGVVISDLTLLENMDAMLLENVELYNEDIAMGGLSYHGCVNFTTKRNYVKALQFPSNVRVVDFQGVAYPVAYYGAVPPGDGQDLRQLLYWDPVLRLDAGADSRVEIHTPGYAGRFKVVAEGFTEDGRPVYQEFSFEVE